MDSKNIYRKVSLGNKAMDVFCFFKKKIWKKKIVNVNDIICRNKLYIMNTTLTLIKYGELHMD